MTSYRLQEVQLLAPGFAPCPSSRLFYDYCNAKIIKKLPASLRTIRSDAVTGLELKPNTLSNKQPDADSRLDTPYVSCIVSLSSGETISAGAVVVAAPTHACFPVIPAWAKPLFSRQEERINTPEAAIALMTNQNAPRIETASSLADSSLNQSIPSVSGRRVLIIGGGMTAASLALKAIDSSASSVTLLARRTLCRQTFECSDVGWWGTKHLAAFWHESDPEERMKAARRARLQASLDPITWAALLRAATAGKVRVIEGCQVVRAEESASTQEDQGPSSWWAVSTECTFPAREPKPSPERAPGAGGYPTNNTTGSEFSKMVPGGQQELMDQHLAADVIWIACGEAFDVDTHPVLSALQRVCPTRVVAGYPVIDPGTCVWPGAPVYIIGKGAMLAMGPAAGSLAGIKLAADRIARSLTRSLKQPNLINSQKTLSTVDNTEDDVVQEQDRVADDVPDWQMAAKSLASQLKDSGAPQEAPTTPSTFGSSSYTEKRTSTTIIMENCLVKESEGPLWWERVVRSSVTKPPHLIDVSDLPASLPRREIQKFVFSDDDFEVSVIISLPEPVPESSVRSMITERSLEVWAVGKEAAYRVHVPRLYGKIIPARCALKVKESKKRVVVVLFKEKDTEWRFLRG